MGHDVSELLKGLRTLPVAPQVLPRLQVLLSDLDTDNDDLAGTIRLDSALAARVLKTSNSAFHARGEPVASIEDAIQTLGYQETFRIVAQSSYGPFLNRKLEIYHLEAGALWDSSLITATALEQLCRSSTTDPNIGYVVGLLHAVGKLPLNDFVVKMDFRPMPDLSNPENSVRLEIALLGHNYGEVGAALLQTWGFPDVITGVIAQQCTPELAGDQMDLALRLKLAVSWAAELMARASGLTDGKDVAEDPALREQVGVDAPTADEIKQKAWQLWQDVRAAG